MLGQCSRWPARLQRPRSQQQAWPRGVQHSEPIGRGVVEQVDTADAGAEHEDLAHVSLGANASDVFDGDIVFFAENLLATIMNSLLHAKNTQAIKTCKQAKYRS